MELPQALEDLINIFGPGTQELCTKLLDDLAIDSFGESRTTWDIAIGEAIDHLNRLIRKGKQKEKGSGMFEVINDYCWLFPTDDTPNSTQDMEVDEEQQTRDKAIAAYNKENAYLLSWKSCIICQGVLPDVQASFFLCYITLYELLLLLSPNVLLKLLSL